MEKFEKKIYLWAKKNIITLNSEYNPSAGFENETYESLHQCLFDINHDSGLNPPMPGVMASENVYELEFGTGPSEYYLECVLDVLELVKKHDDKCTWNIDGVSSEDSWESAQVTLKNDEGSIVNFTINEVNSSDWISNDFFKKMQKFTAEHCSLTVIAIYVDAFYQMIALPHEAAEELQQCIVKYSMSYANL